MTGESFFEDEDIVQTIFRFGEEGLQGGGGGGGGFGGADPNDIFRMFFGGGEGFIKLKFFYILKTINIDIFMALFKNQFDKRL